MKLATIIALISTWCYTVLAMAGGFPKTASAPWALRRRTIPTNAELIRRGLPPSRPRKMYNERANKARQAIPGTPSSTAVGGARVYRLVECVSNATVGGQRFLLDFTDPQDLANQCAEKQNAQGRPDPQQFGIRNIRDNTNCFTVTGPTFDTVVQSCDTADGFNLALYSSV